MIREIVAWLRRPSNGGPPLGHSITLALALLLGGCGPLEPAGPCVGGLSSGDTLRVTVLEPYDERTTTRYDIATFFGADDTLDALLASCSPGRDALLGATLTLHVLGYSTGAYGHGCEVALLDASDAPIELGEPTPLRTSMLGGFPFAMATHLNAEVDGCTRQWFAYLHTYPDADLFAPVVAGQLPSVLLARRIAPTVPECSYAEDDNICLFVAQLEKL